MDLNKFKQINDTLGHDVGDELLKKFARILQAVVRGKDTIARIGGDEFTILLADPKSRSDVIGIAKRIQEKCLTPYEIKGHAIKISTSIGIALSTSGFSDGKEMLNAADQAMYKAKLGPDTQYIISE
jgi:diguanylate cyclase (GGDEF)-like protein